MSLGLTRQRPGALPLEVTGFVGRQRELAELTGLLRTARLVTVTGPGGVGKTRVALRAAAQFGAAQFGAAQFGAAQFGAAQFGAAQFTEPGVARTGVAGEFPDGTWLVELSWLRDPELLADTVATALGLPGTESHSQLDAILEHLRDQRLLLILDTCEHLIDACAMLADILLRATPVTVLATSRQPLDVPGEHTCAIPPLPVPAPRAANVGDGDAVELFAQCAAAAGAPSPTPTGPA
jgi:predicted ATPase